MATSQARGSPRRVARNAPRAARVGAPQHFELRVMADSLPRADAMLLHASTQLVFFMRVPVPPERHGL